MSDRDGMIYVVYHDGDWQEYRDTWAEGQLGRADLPTPPGLLEPERGFGKVWREQLGGVSAKLGWATQKEMGVEMTIQPMNGTGIIVSFGGAVYYLPHGKVWSSN